MYLDSLHVQHIQAIHIHVHVFPYTNHCQLLFFLILNSLWREKCQQCVINDSLYGITPSRRPALIYNPWKQVSWITHAMLDKLIWYTIGPKSFLFGTAQLTLWASGTVNYDYIVTNSIISLLIGSRCVHNGANTNHVWTNLARALKLI